MYQLLEYNILEVILLCPQGGLSLKESKKYRIFSYWKAYCLDNEWQSYVCNLCKDKPIQAPCDQSQIRWQKVKKTFFIKN